MISALVICKNEQKIIRNCLESIKWADEIIIIDSFSTDDTIKICSEYTSKIYQKNWEGFANQKFFGVSKCNGEWIFSIDADEVCTEPLKNEILNKLNDINHLYDGFLIPRRNYFKNHRLKFGGSYPDYQLRLFKKDKVRINNRLVHESFIIDGKISKLENHIDHYPYKTFREYLDKINYYSTLSAEEKYKSLKKSNIFLIIFRPIFEFKKNYLFQLGFLDGIAGFYKALFHFLTKLFTEIKLWELHHNSEQDK
ncbi:MAG: glycosyltransferase family 2 protein [Ignavibacteria bacterium]|nr:glycosyltransferase family 2 protein [Ignavibacteria bacterium]